MPARCSPRSPSTLVVASSAALAWCVLAHAAVAAAQPTTRVLVVGDSQLVETAGEVLDGLLRLTPGFEVTTRAVWGTHPRDWTRGAELPRRRFFFRDPGGARTEGVGVRVEPMLDLARRAAADVVVVALGANTVEVSSAARRRHVTALVDAIAEVGARCIWVGPPSGWARDPVQFAELYDDLAAVLDGRCALIDSRELSEYPREWGGDGVHLETASTVTASGHTRELCMAETARPLAPANDSPIRPLTADDVCATGPDLARVWASAVYREVLRAYRRFRAAR